MKGYYTDESSKTFFEDDNIESIAKGTWLPNGTLKPEVSGARRYGVAKMCATMMIGELQERLDADLALQGISVVGVDPG